jgi:hypothetical protein
MRQTGLCPAAEDFQLAVNDVGAAIRVAKTGQFVEGELGDQRAHIRLAVAVGHV